MLLISIQYLTLWWSSIQRQEMLCCRRNEVFSTSSIWIPATCLLNKCYNVASHQKPDLGCSTKQKNNGKYHFILRVPCCLSRDHPFVCLRVQIKECAFLFLINLNLHWKFTMAMVATNHRWLLSTWNVASLNWDVSNLCLVSFLRQLLKNFKSHMWFTLSFNWTVLF